MVACSAKGGIFYPPAAEWQGCKPGMVKGWFRHNDYLENFATLISAKAYHCSLFTNCGDCHFTCPWAVTSAHSATYNNKQPTGGKSSLFPRVFFLFVCLINSKNCCFGPGWRLPPTFTAAGTSEFQSHPALLLDLMGCQVFSCYL